MSSFAQGEKAKLRECFVPLPAEVFIKVCTLTVLLKLPAYITFSVCFFFVVGFVVSAITCPWELSFVLWLAHVCLWSRLHSPLVSPPHPFLLAFCFVNPSLSVQGASGLDGRPGPPVSVISPIPYVPVPWCCDLSPLSCHNHICITVFPTTEQN